MYGHQRLHVHYTTIGLQIAELQSTATEILIAHDFEQQVSSSACPGTL